MVSLCTLCATRESESLVGVSDVELDIWVGSACSASPTIDICPSCNGILQCGSTIVNQLRGELDAAHYDDVYGWYVSVQLSADILFRSYIQGIVSSENFGKSSGLKELARGLITRAIVRERYHEHYPKLTMEVQFEGSEREVPDELMKAVNQMIRRRGGGKKFRTRLSVNIADVQQFIESTKNDGCLVYKALFPNDDAIKEEPEMLRELKEKFIDRIPAVFPKIKTMIRRETLFLVGKYTKTSREFGQSQWELNATSVSETICPPVCELFGSSVENCLFSASGREDMDVRMLGDGRAFVLQVGDAKRLSPILDGGNLLSAFTVDTGDVCVKGLRWVDKGVLDFLQWSTEQHIKTYRSIIYSEETLPTHFFPYEGVNMHYTQGMLHLFEIQLDTMTD